MTLDRLAENYSFQSPYVYAANSPILYIDKNGDGPILGLFGLAAGALVETGSQIIGNLATGNKWNDLDYADIGIAAVEGGVAGLTNGGSLVMGRMISDFAKASVDVKLVDGDFEKRTIVDGSKPALEVAVELVVGQVGGELAKETATFVKNVTQGAENVVENISKKMDATFDNAGASLSEKTLSKEIKLEAQNGATEIVTNSAEKISTAAQSELTSTVVESIVVNDEKKSK